jgi:8-hydroxy-5-deazaflavin:NADPH oxidoreductase
VLAIGHDDSGAEMLQRLVPGAHVVKAFNILGAEDMVSPGFPEGPPTMLVCGDHKPAVEQAIALCALAAGSWDVAFRLIRRGDS